MDTPVWLLSLSYWLHMAATVVWIGGLFFQSVILLPALRTSPPSEADFPLIERIRKRFDPLAWLSLTILVGTGLIQMSANPNYLGLFALGNRWAVAIFAKHLAIGLMVALAVYQTWILQPKLNRLLLKSRGAKGVDREADEDLSKRFSLTIQGNLLLGILVLALTSLARALS